MVKCFLLQRKPKKYAIPLINLNSIDRLYLMTQQSEITSYLKPLSTN